MDDYAHEYAPRQQNYREVERHLAYASAAGDGDRSESEAWREVVVNCVGALAHALVDVADGLRDAAETRSNETVGAGVD